VGGLQDNIYLEVSGAMNNLLEQRLWKWKLVAGVLTIILGAVVLPEQFRQHLSLMHGWIPMTVQVMAAVALLAAIGWRTLSWRLLWLPRALIVGAALTAAAYWYIASEGLAGDDPAPHRLWIWIGLSGVAAAVLLAGWRGARWWWRGVSVLAVPLCLLCAALAVNLWVGYFPTVQTAWNQLTAGPLPGQTDQVTVAVMQKLGKVPAKGTVVPVSISDGASGFRHRGELVYLPPAWYATNPPPRLPTVMMIGGEFNTPADWLRAGNAGEDGRRLRRRPRRQRAGAGLCRFRRRVQQRHRMRERNPWQCRGSPNQRCCTFYDFKFWCESRPSQLGCRRLVDGRHLRRRPDGDAPRHVQRVRGHRR
jgi:hypothetical protein